MALLGPVLPVVHWSGPVAAPLARVLGLSSGECELDLFCWLRLAPEIRPLRR